MKSSSAASLPGSARPRAGFLVERDARAGGRRSAHRSIEGARGAAIGLACLLASSGCGAGARTKAGAVMFFVGGGAIVPGAVLATTHCDPSPERCRTRTSSPEVGIPIAVAGGLVMLAGAGLLLSAPAAGAPSASAPPRPGPAPSAAPLPVF